MKIISWLFAKLSFRLLASAQSLTLCNSAERESTFTAGIIAIATRRGDQTIHEKDLDKEIDRGNGLHVDYNWRKMEKQPKINLVGKKMKTGL